MTDSLAIDWTDDTPRPLDEAARLAFPNGGATGETLRRKIREGKLAGYRPGKAYVTTLRDVWAMIQATRVQPSTKPIEKPTVPDPPRDPYAEMFGLTHAQAAHDRALYKLKSLRANEHARKDESARKAHTQMMKERRRKRARDMYRKKKEARLKAAQKPPLT